MKRLSKEFLFTLTKPALVALVLVGIALLPLGTPTTHWDSNVLDTGIQKKYQIEAAIVSHVIRSTQFGSDSQINAPITLCIVGSKSVFDYFRPISDLDYSKYHVNAEHKLSSSSLANCHVVFVGGSDPTLASDVIKKTKGLHILTIGEVDGFCEIGGIFNFTKGEGGKIAFEISKQNAINEEIKIESQIISRAKRVVEG